MPMDTFHTFTAHAAAPSIDPQDPFGNETEFAGYNPDYGDIVPQIRIPGCRIPLRPNAREKSRLRRYHNIVGGFLLGHLVVTNVIIVIMIELFYLFTSMVDASRFGGQLPSGYDTTLSEYLSGSSTMIAMTCLVYGLFNALTACVGCKVTKIPVSSLFQTRSFHAGHAVTYVCIALFLQTVTGWAAVGLTDLFEGVGITLYEADMSTSQDAKSTVISLVYSVLVAPVTEELLMRGFVLKNLSRSSQRFGILMSAFLFGIWHENVAQFILAFTAGCFFGYIAMKHNSLVPSIICHMVVNCFAELFTIFETYGLDYAYSIANMVYLLLVVAGMILLATMWFTDRMPQTTPEQTERGFRITLTSIPMLLVCVLHIGFSVYLIVDASTAL